MKEVQKPLGSNAHKERQMHCEKMGVTYLLKTSSRLGYIETIAQWRKKFRKFHFKKNIGYTYHSFPGILWKKKLRHLVAMFKVSPNKVCFEKGVMDHY